MRSKFTKIDWHHPIIVLLWTLPAHAFLVFSSMTSMNVVVLSEIEDTGWGGSRNRSTADNVSVETWPEPRKPTSATLSHTHVTNAGCKTFLGGPPPPPVHQQPGATMYSRFISAVSSARQPSLIREMTQVSLARCQINPQPLLQILASAPPEMIPLSGGFPNPQMFPFKQLTLEVTGGEPIVLEGKGLQVNHVFFSPQPNCSGGASIPSHAWPS